MTGNPSRESGPPIHKWRGPADVSPGHVAIGRIIGPWRRTSRLEIEPLTDFPERFEPGQTVYLRGRPHTIESSQWQGSLVVIKLAGVETPAQAERLSGRYLEIPESTLHPLEPDTYYTFQILGLRVLTEDGRPLGTVTEIIRTGSNDVYVVRDNGNELLLPAIEDVIKRVDLERRELIVALLEGLTGE